MKRSNAFDVAAHRGTAGRMIGLGAGPSSDPAGDLTAIGKCAFGNVPVIEYVTWTVPLPLTDIALGQTFGDEINILTGPSQVPGVASVDSSFVLNGLLQTDMFVVGFGVHAFGEPMSFSQIGNSIPSASSASSPPASPDVFSVNDLANGALGVTTGVTPALLEWGFADWNALWHLVNAYQFQWIFQQRHYLIQELAADVSYFGPYAEGVGMGTSDAPVAQFVRQVNNQYAGLAATSRFAPVTHRRYGSVNNGSTGNTFTGTNEGVFHPSREFDLAPMSWGGLRNQGTTGQQIPFRRLGKPVMLEKGIPIGMKLSVQDAYHQAQMLRYMSISENAGTNSVALVQIDQFITGSTLQTGGSTGHTALELTYDQGGNQFASQQVNTDRALYKGGTMKLAILIKGFEVWGPWKRYFVDHAAQIQHLVDVPSVTGSLSGLAVPGLRS